jgi:hypothetical protein
VRIEHTVDSGGNHAEGKAGRTVVRLLDGCAVTEREREREREMIEMGSFQRKLPI